MNVTKQRVLLAGFLLASCGAWVGAQSAKPSTSTKAKKIRVWFVEPKNNASVTSPLHMKFASEGIEISPVPPGDLKETRPGVAH